MGTPRPNGDDRSSPLLKGYLERIAAALERLVVIAAEHQADKKLKTPLPSRVPNPHGPEPRGAPNRTQNGPPELLVVWWHCPLCETQYRAEYYGPAHLVDQILAHLRDNGDGGHLESLDTVREGFQEGRW